MEIRDGTLIKGVARMFEVTPNLEQQCCHFGTAAELTFDSAENATMLPVRTLAAGTP